MIKGTDAASWVLKYRYHLNLIKACLLQHLDG